MKSNSINTCKRYGIFELFPQVHNKIILSYSHIISLSLSLSHFLSLSISFNRVDAVYMYIWDKYVAEGDKQPFSVASNAAKVRQHASCASEMVSVRAAHTHTHIETRSHIHVDCFFLFASNFTVHFRHFIIGTLCNYCLHICG